MAERNKLTVQIANKDYTLISEETREYMLEVSDYVDRQMKKIKELNACMSANMVAVLTAVNLADELFKTKKKLAEAEAKVSEEQKRADNPSAAADNRQHNHSASKHGKN